MAFLLKGVLWLGGVRWADHNSRCVVVGCVDCKGFICDHDIRRSVGLPPWWGDGGRCSLLGGNLIRLPGGNAGFLAKIPWLKFLHLRKYMNKEIVPKNAPIYAQVYKKQRIGCTNFLNILST